MINHLVTGEKAAEELLDTRQKLLSIIEFLPDATFVVDRDRKVIAWNRAIEDMTGLGKEDIIGKGGYIYAVPFYGEARPIIIDHVFEDEKSGEYQYKLHYQKEKNTLFAEEFAPSLYQGRGAHVWAKASPLLDVDGNIIGAIESIRDITQLRTMEAQLIQSQKMEAVGRLAGGIAHDFNNILTGILGNVSYILTDLTPVCEYFEALKEIEESALMATDIVEKLLGFSRKSLMKSTVVNINDIINEAYRIVERTIDPRIIIRTSLDHNLWPAAADKTLIIQILINLCLNAQDAMAEGGAITIKTENITIDENGLRNQPSYVRAGEFVRISVADTGCGMPSEVQEQIFEPFFTTKKAGHGTGLGLAMVYGIVKQLEGWINCHSEIGHGTTFTIHLPRAIFSVLQVSPDNFPDRKAPLSADKTVLVVEDNTIVKNFIKRILARNGFKVIMAGDGEEAVDLYRRGWENIDLVLLDMTIPKLNGRDALINMKKINPSIKALLTSGYLFSDNEEPLLSEYQFLHKPFTENDLLRQIEKLLY